jgi:hypothetical protein
VTSHPIFAAFYRWAGWLGDRAGFAARRRRLLADAAGVVVEIGAGTGLNFRHYPAGLEVLATEPDPHMLKAARKAARRAKAELTLRQAAASGARPRRRLCPGPQAGSRRAPAGRFAGGCHPNRDTLRAVAAAGFDTGGVRPVTLPGMKITSPGIAGVARKRGR